MTLPLVAMLAAFTPLAARASVNFASVNFNHSGSSLPGTFADVDHRGGAPFSITAPGSIDKLIELTDFEMPALPTVAVAELPQPSVETPLHKLFCVEYARARSGLAVFGDAKFWWSRAKNLYARATAPMENAVMVFSGSTRLKKGHVAVVTNIISKREIRVDQANWQNHGEIDHATPVLDVSAKNDWSQVRVWYTPGDQWGRRVMMIVFFADPKVAVTCSGVLR